MHDDIARLRSAIAAQGGQPFGSSTIAHALGAGADRIGQLLALHARELDIAIVRQHPRQYRANNTGGVTLQSLLGYRLPAAMQAGRLITERHACGRSFTASHEPPGYSSALAAMDFA